MYRRDVSESAAAISPRSIHARLKTEVVPSEIAPLVDSFNRVLERLENGYRVQKEFLGTAAHELKTPLALIRAQIELGEDGPQDRDALLSDVEYMTRQVQQLLLLAEASEAHNYNFTTVRVQDAADEAAAYLQRMAGAADVRLEVSAVADNVEWQADRGALFTVLKNLLENAIQHAPAKTIVSVEIQRDAVTVRDSGPGVDAAQLRRRCSSASPVVRAVLARGASARPRGRAGFVHLPGNCVGTWLDSHGRAGRARIEVSARDRTGRRCIAMDALMALVSEVNAGVGIRSQRAPFRNLKAQIDERRWRARRVEPPRQRSRASAVPMTRAIERLHQPCDVDVGQGTATRQDHGDLQLGAQDV